MRPQGKSILITAAARRMARAAAIACAEAGATVFATDINREGLASLQGECPAIRTFALDVTNSDEIAALVNEQPKLDGLFNCAGFVHHGAVLDISDADWAFSFDLNVTSMMRMCRAFLPGMLERASETGTASIVNMASSIKGFANSTAYGATKASVIALTKAIAAEKPAIITI